MLPVWPSSPWAVQQPQKRSSTREGLLSFAQPHPIEYRPREDQSPQDQGQDGSDPNPQQQRYYTETSEQHQRASGSAGQQQPYPNAGNQTHYQTDQTRQHRHGSAHFHQGATSSSAYQAAYGQPSAMSQYQSQPQHVATAATAGPLVNVSGVTRVRDEQRTSYKVKTDRGTMRVLAPIGSSEAQLFDAIADANSAAPRRNEADMSVSRIQAWRDRLGW